MMFLIFALLPSAKGSDLSGDPDDVFIHAEERKKQLAKQRKRTTK
jgi:hypothetical protein